MYFFYRLQKKDNWPVIEKLEVEVHKRGKLIGPGGVNLKKLLVETGVQVQLEKQLFSFICK